MGAGVIIGVDPGSRRVGIALADDDTRMAQPHEVVDAEETDPIARIASLAAELGARAIVVGKPISLSGRDGPAVEVQREFVEALRGATSVPVLEHDERLSTVVADQGLRAAGGRSKARGRIRDAVAAQVMLQGYLDAEGREA